jgi:Ca2+-binding RTX toxin-like protein
MRRLLLTAFALLLSVELIASAWAEGDTGFEVCTVAASCQRGAYGGLGGEFALPTGVASDAAGNVYVVDEAAYRIQKFDSSGNWERAWGRDVVAGGGTGFEVCTVAASCKGGIGGQLGGELTSPTGVAVDAAGKVYVADGSNLRIQKFDSSGNWERAWGKDVVGSPPPAPPAPPAPPSATCRGKQATIVGTDGADQITGSRGADVIVGLGGKDKLSGLAGNDVLCGAKGNDTLKGGAGNDQLSGQKGDDKLYGQKGNDKLSGKGGSDTLKGGPGKDILKGGPGKDKQVQ